MNLKDLNLLISIFVFMTIASALLVGPVIVGYYIGDCISGGNEDRANAGAFVGFWFSVISLTAFGLIKEERTK